MQSSSRESSGSETALNGGGAGANRVERLLGRLRVPLIVVGLVLLLGSLVAAAFQPVRGDALAVVEGWTSVDWWVRPVERNAYQRAAAVEGKLNDIQALPNTDEVFAIGDGGLVIHSRDGGVTWTKREDIAGLLQASDYVKGIERLNEMLIGGVAIAPGGDIKNAANSGSEVPNRAVEPQPAARPAANPAQSMPASSPQGTGKADDRDGALLKGAGGEPQSSPVQSVPLGKQGEAGKGPANPATVEAGVPDVSQRGASGVDGKDGGGDAADVDPPVLPRLNDVFFLPPPNERYGWIVGDRGTMLRTTDAGKTWAVQNIPRGPVRTQSGALSDFTAVAFRDARSGYVAADQYMYRCTAAGDQPDDLTVTAWLDVRRPVSSIVLDGVSRVMLFAASGEFIEGFEGEKSAGTGSLTTRGLAFVDLETLNMGPGAEWYLPAWTSTRVDTVEAAIGSDRPVVVASSEGREFSARFDRGPFAWLLRVFERPKSTRLGWWPSSITPVSMSLADDDRGYALCGNGVIFATRDGGVTWRTGLALIDQPAFTRSGRFGLAATGTLGVFLSTRDFGRTWDATRAPVAFGAGGDDWKGAPRRTTSVDDDAGGSVELPLPYAFPPWGISNWAGGLSDSASLWPGEETLWFEDARGDVLVTGDGGRTWSAVSRVKGPQPAPTRSQRSFDVYLRDAENPYSDADFARLERGELWRPLAYRRFPAPLVYPLAVVGGAMVLAGFRVRARVRQIREQLEDLFQTDAAIRSAAQDTLGHKRVAEAVSRFIQNPGSGLPFTIAIHGRWGSGKSSIMEMVREHLRGAGYSPLWFNAWHHQDENLLAALLESVQKRGVPPLFTARGVRVRVVLGVLRSLAALRNPKTWLWLAVLSASATLTAKQPQIQVWLEEMAAYTAGASKAPGAALASDDAKQEAKPGAEVGTGITEDEEKSGQVETKKEVKVQKHTETSVGAEGERAPYRETRTETMTKTLLKAAADNAGQALKIGGVLSGLVAAFQLLWPAWKRMNALGLNPADLLATTSAAPDLKQLQRQTGFRLRFEEGFREYAAALRPQRLVIFIDDLDRCAEANVVKVLEAVNFLMVSGECVVVIGMDEEYVRAAVSLQFGSIAEEMNKRRAAAGESPRDFAQDYVEKLLNISVAVPRGIPAGDEPQAERGSRRMRVVEMVKRLPWVVGRALVDPEAPGSWLREIPKVVLVLCVLWGASRVGLMVNGVLHPPVVARAATDAGAGAGTSAPPGAPSTPEGDSGTVLPNAARADLRPGVPAVVTSSDLVTILVLAVGAVAVVVLYSLRPPPGSERTVDSPKFKAALRLWEPHLRGLLETPRAYKRHTNRLRFISILSRIGGESGSSALPDDAIVGIGAEELVKQRVTQAAKPAQESDRIRSLVATHRAEHGEKLEGYEKRFREVATIVRFR